MTVYYKTVLALSSQEQSDSTNQELVPKMLKQMAAEPSLLHYASSMKICSFRWPVPSLNRPPLGTETFSVPLLAQMAGGFPSTASAWQTND
jgi:hypothetical protein